MNRSKLIVGVLAIEVALGAVLVVDTVSSGSQTAATSSVTEAYGFALSRLLLVLVAILVIASVAVYRYRRYW